MPNYCDLNLSNPALKEKERELGFHSSYTLEVIKLQTRADYNKAKDSLVCLESESIELLREAVKRLPYCIVNPLTARNFERETALIQDVVQKGAAFEIPISGLLATSSASRAKLLSQISIFLRACIKLKAPFIFSSRATTELGLRSPREIIAIGSLLGLTFEQAQYAISGRPEEIAKKLSLQ